MSLKYPSREYDGRAFARKSINHKKELHWKYWSAIKKYCHFYRISKVLCGPDANLRSFLCSMNEQWSLSPIENKIRRNL